MLPDLSMQKHPIVPISAVDPETIDRGNVLKDGGRYIQTSGCCKGSLISVDGTDRICITCYDCQNPLLCLCHRGCSCENDQKTGTHCYYFCVPFTLGLIPLIVEVKESGKRIEMSPCCCTFELYENQRD